MIEDGDNIDFAAETFIKAIAEARLEILRVLTATEIARIQQVDPELAHDALDRRGGFFIAAVCVRIEELHAARARLKPMGRT